MLRRPSSVPNQELIAFVRVRIRRNWEAYFFSTGLLIAASLGLLSYMLGLLSMCLEGFPIKFWKYLLQTWPQVLLVPLGLEQLAQVNENKILFIYLCLALLAVAFFFFLYVKRLFTDWWNLLAFARSGQSMKPLTHMGKFLRITSTSWLFPTFVENPSPSEVRQLVQEYEEMTKAWSILPPIEDKTSEGPSPITILISLAEELTLTLIGPDGKQKKTVLTASKPILVTFLATKSVGIWIKRKDILVNVYGGEGNDEIAHFHVDVRRINKQVNEEAVKAGFLDEEILQREPAQLPLKLFDNEMIDGKPMWRLSSACRVEVYQAFDALYGRMLSLQNQANLSTTKEDLRRLSRQTKQSYGNGYLMRYRKYNIMWKWAKEVYRTYQNKCLTVLEYAARQEQERVDELPYDQQLEARQEAAILYGWIAIISSTLVLDSVRSKAALMLCLRLYHGLNDLSSAKLVYQKYVEEMRQRDICWEPEDDIKEVWSEATSIEEKPRRTRKKEY